MTLLARDFEPDEILAPGTEKWLRIWYAAICRLPAARQCDAELVVLDAPVRDGDDAWVHGHFETKPDGSSVITCALDANPSETLGTLVHEVAHFAANPRHRRHHGYSFRNQMAGMVSDLTGVDITHRCNYYRRHFKALSEGYGQLSRTAALDLATVHEISRCAPWIYRRGDRLDRFEACMGGQRFVVRPGEIR